MVFLTLKQDNYCQIWVLLCYWLNFLLIIPHFYGITGELIWNKDYVKLKFWVHPVLKTDYDTNNNSPAYNARYDTVYSPSINLFLTDDKIKKCLLTKNISWNDTLYLYTTIFMKPSLFFSNPLLEHINVFCPVSPPLKNVPNLKSASIQNQSAGFFT